MMSLSELRELGEKLDLAYKLANDKNLAAGQVFQAVAKARDEYRAARNEWAALLDRLERAERVAEAAKTYVLAYDDPLKLDPGWAHEARDDLRDALAAWRPPGPEGTA